MFTIRWLGTDGQPTGHTTELEEEKTYAEAIWEATKLMRATTKDNKRDVNAGLFPVGFVVEQS